MAATILDGRRILLVEDEPLIALDVEELCLEHGAASVVVMRDVGETQAMDFSAFDVAIVDLILGRRSSLPVAASLKAAGIPFVFSSGYAEAPEIAAEFPEAVLLTKPYAGQALLDALVAALAPAALRDD